MAKRRTFAGLPPVLTGKDRCSPRWKEWLMIAISRGDISIFDAVDRYNITLEELMSWVKVYRDHGRKGFTVAHLRATRELRRKNPDPLKNKYRKRRRE